MGRGSSTVHVAEMSESLINGRARLDDPAASFLTWTDSNCCVSNKDRNVPLASGEQAGQPRNRSSCFFPVLKAAILAPLSCHGQTLWGPAESTDGPGPSVPPLENRKGNSCPADRVPPVRSEAGSLPREALLFYLKGSGISWQALGIGTPRRMHKTNLIFSLKH